MNPGRIRSLLGTFPHTLDAQGTPTNKEGIPMRHARNRRLLRAASALVLTTAVVGAGVAGQAGPAASAPAGSATTYDPAHVIDYWRDASGRAPFSPVVLAHRGLFGSFNRGGDTTIPENSVASLRASAAAHIEGVEMDVRATSDPATPAILHDSHLGRVTNVFDPTVSPNPPSGTTLTQMRSEILAAGGVALPDYLSAEEKSQLTQSLTARSAFSPYPEYTNQAFGTAYGRNPKVSDLSPSTIKNLNLLKFADPAPAPAIPWHRGGPSHVPTVAEVSSEKVPLVTDILATLATLERPPVVVFDIIEPASLTAVAKIIANDTRTYAGGRSARDLTVLKYRAKIAPDTKALVDQLRAATKNQRYPTGFVPNLVAIVAKYYNSPSFSADNFVSSWVLLRQADPSLPLVGLDIVQTSPQGSGTSLLDRAYAAGVSAGSFHDVPSFRGATNLYPTEVLGKKLYVNADGTCCRTADDTGDPTGTKDLRWQPEWLIYDVKNPTTTVHSGMITSDDPLRIIDLLEQRGLRTQATTAYEHGVPYARRFGFTDVKLQVSNPSGQEEGDASWLNVYGDFSLYVEGGSPSAASFSATSSQWVRVTEYAHDPNAYYEINTGTESSLPAAPTGMTVPVCVKSSGGMWDHDDLSSDDNLFAAGTHQCAPIAALRVGDSTTKQIIVEAADGKTMVTFTVTGLS